MRLTHLREDSRKDSVAKRRGAAAAQRPYPGYALKLRQNRSIRSSPFSMFAMLVA